MNFVLHFYILKLTSWISTSPQLKGLNSRALQSEPHMRASTLNIAPDRSRHDNYLAGCDGG